MFRHVGRSPTSATISPRRPSPDDLPDGQVQSCFGPAHPCRLECSAHAGGVGRPLRPNGKKAGFEECFVYNMFESVFVSMEL